MFTVHGLRFPILRLGRGDGPKGIFARADIVHVAACLSHPSKNERAYRRPAMPGQNERD